MVLPFTLETLENSRFVARPLLCARLNEPCACVAAFRAHLSRSLAHTFPLSALSSNRERSTTTSAMFRNTFQSGFLSVLYSIGSKPLQIWNKQVRNGHIKRITDGDILSSVLEIMGAFATRAHAVVHPRVSPIRIHAPPRPQLAPSTPFSQPPPPPPPHTHTHTHTTRRHQRFDVLHLVPVEQEEDAWDQAALPRHDHQELEEVLYVRGAGSR